MMFFSTQMIHASSLEEVISSPYYVSGTAVILHLISTICPHFLMHGTQRVQKQPIYVTVEVLESNIFTETIDSFQIPHFPVSFIPGEYPKFKHCEENVTEMFIGVNIWCICSLTHFWSQSKQVVHDLQSTHSLDILSSRINSNNVFEASIPFYFHPLKVLQTVQVSTKVFDVRNLGIQYLKRQSEYSVTSMNEIYWGRPKPETSMHKTRNSGSSAQREGTLLDLPW